MQTQRPARIVLGVVIWLALAGGVASVAIGRSAELRPPAERVLRYASHRAARIEVTVDGVPKSSKDWDDEYPGFAVPRPGDPVLAGEDRTFVGAIVSVARDTAHVTSLSFVVTIAVDPEYDASSLEGSRFTFGATDGGVEWALETLLPPKKWEEVKRELAAYAKEHAQEIDALLHPIEEQVIEHAMHVLDENFTAAVNHHETEIKTLLDRYRSSLKDHLLPILKDELGPSAKEKARPILTRIGRECWDALPMWQGGWAYLKTKVPFQKKDYVDDWWQDFLDNKAIPILKEHEDELVQAGEDLVKEGFRDPKVRAAVDAELKQLARDPEFRALVRTIVEEALVKPFDKDALLKKITEDAGNKERWRRIEVSLHPVLTDLGRDIAIKKRADGRDGLSPEVARVIRRIVFKKDARWVTVTPRRPLVPLTAGS